LSSHFLDIEQGGNVRGKKGKRKAEMWNYFVFNFLQNYNENISFHSLLKSGVPNFIITEGVCIKFASFL
jgi:hypothetical protein